MPPRRTSRRRSFRVWLPGGEPSAAARPPARARRPATLPATRLVTSRDPAFLLFEQVVERLLGARRTGRRRGGFRLALDGRARLEEGARVARVLGGHARSDWLLALEGRGRIEVHALRAGVQIRVAPRTLPFGAPRRGDRQLVAAPGALHHFPEPGHVEGLRRNGRLAPRRVLLFLLGLALAARLARFVLVASLAIFPVGHAEAGIVQLFGADRIQEVSERGRACRRIVAAEGAI